MSVYGPELIGPFAFGSGGNNQVFQNQNGPYTSLPQPQDLPMVESGVLAPGPINLTDFQGQGTQQTSTGSSLQNNAFGAMQFGSGNDVSLPIQHDFIDLEVPTSLFDSVDELSPGMTVNDTFGEGLTTQLGPLTQQTFQSDPVGNDRPSDTGSHYAGLSQDATAFFPNNQLQRSMQTAIMNQNPTGVPEPVGAPEFVAPALDEPEAVQATTHTQMVVQSPSAVEAREAQREANKRKTQLHRLNREGINIAVNCHSPVIRNLHRDIIASENQSPEAKKKAQDTLDEYRKFLRSNNVMDHPAYSDELEKVPDEVSKGRTKISSSKIDMARASALYSLYCDQEMSRLRSENKRLWEMLHQRNQAPDSEDVGHAVTSD